MAATPKGGSLHAIGLVSRKSYEIDLYHSDVAGGLVNFDSGSGGAGATTQTYLRFSEPVLIDDYLVITGMADTTKLQPIIDGQSTKDTWRYTSHLDTNNNRPRVNLWLAARQEFQLIQRA